MFVFREDYYLDKMEPFRKSGETEEQYNERFQNWKSYLEKFMGKLKSLLQNKDMDQLEL